MGDRWGAAFVRIGWQASFGLGGSFAPDWVAGITGIRTQGFNFVHIFNVFLIAAGIVYVVYFVDQIENFARFARNQERDLKILRESMCQTSPTDGMASFVFQMHVHAL